MWSQAFYLQYGIAGMALLALCVCVAHKSSSAVAGVQQLPACCGNGDLDVAVSDQKRWAPCHQPA